MAGDDRGRLAAGTVYLRHRRAAHPAARPGDGPLSAVSCAGILGGSLFHIGIGAIPFACLACFGLTRFQSGMITFVTAVGAFSSKFLRRAFQSPASAPYGLRHRPLGVS